MIFGRLITAMITPFTREYEIDWKKLEGIVERLIATGSDAIVVAGTTAESPTLSHDEKIQLFQFTLEKAAGRAKVIAGTGSNNTRETIRLSREAEELGIDGLMLVAPYYNRPSQEGLYQHFKAVAESTSVPIMLYNVPARTSVNISVDTMVRLAEINNIVAFKEASGDLNQISQLIAEVPAEIAVYSGDDKLLLPTLAVGGAGIVSVASHIVGSQMKELIQAYFAGDVQQAIRLNQKLLPAFNGLFITSSPAPLKYVMSQQGWCEPVVRLPLVEMTEKEKSLTDDWVKKLL